MRRTKRQHRPNAGDRPHKDRAPALVRDSLDGYRETRRQGRGDKMRVEVRLPAGLDPREARGICAAALAAVLGGTQEGTP